MMEWVVLCKHTKYIGNPLAPHVYPIILFSDARWSTPTLRGHPFRSNAYQTWVCFKFSVSIPRQEFCYEIDLPLGKRLWLSSVTGSEAVDALTRRYR